MSEAHYSPYTAHLKATKMCQNFRASFWWEGMKKDNQLWTKLLNMPTN